MEKLINNQGKESVNISVDRIKPSRYAEKMFAYDENDELTKIIRNEGYNPLYPITVYRIKKGYYEVYSGNRRLKSAIKTGLKEIPCIVIPVPRKKERSESAILENISMR